MATFKSADAYREFAQKVKATNRHIRDGDDLEFLATLLGQAEHGRKRTAPKGTVLWRAQLGFDWELDHDTDEYIESPLPPERMKPLRDRAREGRANPQGIPCLYLSTRKETALSEVRPWLRSLISIGQFKTVRELTIVDFSSDERPRRHNWVFPPEEWDKAVWYAIDRAFRKPVTPEADLPSDYFPTQVIAEFFKAHGFNGIAYQSAFQSKSGKGHNVALFDPDAAELINCGLEEAREINFTFEPVANPYYL